MPVCRVKYLGSTKTKTIKKKTTFIFSNAISNDPILRDLLIQVLHFYNKKKMLIVEKLTYWELFYMLLFVLKSLIY